MNLSIKQLNTLKEWARLVCFVAFLGSAFGLLLPTFPYFRWSVGILLVGVLWYQGIELAIDKKEGKSD